jgi:hypothetical protein
MSKLWIFILCVVVYLVLALIMRKAVFKKTEALSSWRKKYIIRAACVSFLFLPSAIGEAYVAIPLPISLVIFYYLFLAISSLNIDYFGSILGGGLMPMTVYSVFIFLVASFFKCVGKRVCRQ